MKTIHVCQSCGMAINTENQFGTNADKNKNKEYCIFCFKNGEFTFDGTYDEFVKKQVNLAIEKFNIPKKKALEMTNNLIQLKRWKK
jgi:hypothetical protein